MQKHSEIQRLINYDKKEKREAKKQYEDYKVYRVFEFSEQLRQKDVVIWGRGSGAIEIFRLLIMEGANVIAFVDSESKDFDEKFCGKNVISYEMLKELNNNVNIVISTKIIKYSREIAEKLNNDQMNNLFSLTPIVNSLQYEKLEIKRLVKNAEKKINEVFLKLGDKKSKQVFMNLINYRLTNDDVLLELSNEKGENQYFPKDVFLKLSDEEVFVDAGGYIGDTILEFIDKVKGKYKKIYSFEPDGMLFSIISTLIAKQQLLNIELFPYGLYNSSGEMSFWNGSETGSSKITKIGTSKIRTEKLDDIIPEEVEVSYIKMDIEGVEREALDGADTIIKKYYPKLAISIYHKADDLWEIPYQIMTNYPEYDIYIRHYREYEATETVCYAVKK